MHTRCNDMCFCVPLCRMMLLLLLLLPRPSPSNVLVRDVLSSIVL
jgi:hypothetical protein